MEALSPLARVFSLSDAAAAGIAEAVASGARELGATDSDAARIASASRLVVADLHEGSVVVAPLRTPWGDVLDVVASSHTAKHGVLPAALASPRGGDWSAEADIPSGVLGVGAPALLVRAMRFAVGSSDGRAPWPGLDVAGFVRAYPGQAVSGDAVALWATRRGVRALVVDALGHGEGAARSAQSLVRHLSECTALDAEAAMTSAHARRAANPRGAAAAILDLDLEDGGEGRYVGVGNIEAVAVGEATRPLSRAGTVGLAVPRLTAERVSMSPGSGLAIASDGLILRWPSFTTNGVAALAAPLLLGVVLATAERRTDDASVLVVRRPR